MHAWRSRPSHGLHPAFRDDSRRRMPRQAQRPHRNDGGGGWWGRLAIVTVREFVSFSSEKRRHVEPLRGSTPPAITGCGLRPANIVGSVKPFKGFTVVYSF